MCFRKSDFCTPEFLQKPDQAKLTDADAEGHDDAGEGLGQACCSSIEEKDLRAFVRNATFTNFQLAQKG